MIFCSKPIVTNLDSCNTKVAGIVEVKIAPVNDPSNEITLYTIPETSHLESVFAYNAQNGTGIWTSTLFIKIGEISETNRTAVESMAFNNVIIKAETQSGKVVTVGTTKRPAYMSAGNLATGTAMEDAMGYDVTFTQKDITSPEVLEKEAGTYTFTVSPTSVALTPGQTKTKTISVTSTETKNGAIVAADYTMSTNFQFQANQGMHATLDKTTNTITLVSRGFVTYTDPKITLTQAGSGKVITIPVTFTNPTTNEYVLKADVTSVAIKPEETKQVKVTSYNTSDPSTPIKVEIGFSWYANVKPETGTGVKGTVSGFTNPTITLQGLNYADIGSDAKIIIKQHVDSTYYKTLEIPVSFSKA